jgi:Arc/MetJ family transcription regulator
MMCMKRKPKPTYRPISKKEKERRSEAVFADLESSAATTPAEVRTNIVMEEPLVMKAQEVTGIKTKTGVVHYALREVVRRAKQKEMLAFRGKVAWEGDLDEMRRSSY